MLTATDNFGAITAETDLFRFYLQGLSAGISVTGSMVFRDSLSVDSDGKSDQISWPEDRAFLAALRRNCQIVITSGRTARAEKLRMPKSAKLAIVSKSQDLTGTDIDPGHQDLVMLFGRANVADYFQDLRGMGVRKMQVEFGQTTMREAWSGGEIDLLLLSSQGELDAYLFDSLRQVFELKLGAGRVAGFVSGVATTEHS